MSKKIEIRAEFLEFDSEHELAKEEQELLEKARKASSTAYAPYSGFCVGAALLLENGKIVTGNNQENAAYPTGLCAERVAAFAASSQFPGIPFKTIAITCSSKKHPVVIPESPCGSCRQSLMEYEILFKKNIRVILCGESGKVWILNSIADLLPLAFNGKNLK